MDKKNFPSYAIFTLVILVTGMLFAMEYETRKKPPVIQPLTLGAGETLFSDTCTEASSVELSTHTPETGTGWTDLGGDNELSISGSSDAIRPSSTGNSQTAAYSADTTYLSANYSISVDIFNNASGDDYFYVLVRLTDLNNWYGLRFNADGGQIVKNVSGTPTELGSACGGFADSSTVKLAVEGTALTAYEDDVEVCSATDSDISATGTAAIGLGNLEGNDGDVSAGQYLDNVLIINIGETASAEERHDPVIFFTQ